MFKITLIAIAKNLILQDNGVVYNFDKFWIFIRLAWLKLDTRFGVRPGYFSYFFTFFMVRLFSMTRSRVISKYYTVWRVPYGYDYHLFNKAEKLKKLNSPTPISYDTYSRFAAVAGVITSGLSTNYSVQTTGRLKYLPASPEKITSGSHVFPDLILWVKIVWLVWAWREYVDVCNTVRKRERKEE